MLNVLIAMFLVLIDCPVFTKKIFAARKRCCRKVMFSQACVSLFTGEGVVPYLPPLPDYPPGTRCPPLGPDTPMGLDSSLD